MSGFVTIQRAALDHPLFQGDVSRLGAWVWLVGKACWKPTPFNISGKMVTLERGQLCVSVRQLAEQWGWSKSTVDRFLTRLETETMIAREAGHGRLILTITNYSKYQDVGDPARDSSGTASGTAAGQQRDIKEQGNKGTIEEDTDVSSIPPTPRKSAKRDLPEVPAWVPAEAWNAFVEMRQRKRQPLTGHAAKLIFDKLERWRTTGQDPGAILDQSTEHGWTGIFELKDDRRGTAHRSAEPPRNSGDGFTRAIDRRLHAGDAQGFADEPQRSAVRTGQGDSQGHLALPAGGG